MNITLKMQVFFIENSKTFEETINEYHENLNKKTTSLVKEIIEGAAKSKDELIIIQRKIIVDIVLQTALGSPSNHEVYCIIKLIVFVSQRFLSGAFRNWQRTQFSHD